MRSPLQVDGDFENKIKQLQKKIMLKEGTKVSIRELTKRIAKDFDLIEEKVIGKKKPEIDFVKFDRRLR